MTVIIEHMRADYAFDDSRDSYLAHPVDIIEPEDEVDSYRMVADDLLSFSKELLSWIVDQPNTAKAVWQGTFALGLACSDIMTASRTFKTRPLDLWAGVQRLFERFWKIPNVENARTKLIAWLYRGLAHIGTHANPKTATFQFAYQYNIDLMDGASMRKQADVLNVKVASISNGVTSLGRTYGFKGSVHSQTAERRAIAREARLQSLNA